MCQKPQRVMKSEALLITALIIATGGAIWRTAVLGSGSVVERAAEEELDRRIAILPFENLSGDPESQPFVDGLHEDLIIRLSNVEGLIVISKGSAGRFAPSSGAVRDIDKARALAACVIR